MSTIKVGENESVESALRRFKRKCSRDGIIGDLRKKEFYEKPSVKKSFTNLPPSRGAKRRKPQEKEIKTNSKKSVGIKVSADFFHNKKCRIKENNVSYGRYRKSCARRQVAS